MKYRIKSITKEGVYQAVYVQYKFLFLWLFVGRWDNVQSFSPMNFSSIYYAKEYINGKKEEEKKKRIEDKIEYIYYDGE